jgi:diacylglycerol kinase
MVCILFLQPNSALPMQWKKRLQSFKFAFQGIADLFRSQPNARIHLAVAVVVVAMGAYLGLSVAEWCMVSLLITLVLALEAVNTALEYLTDLVSPEYHPLAGKAKDAAAGAVLIMTIGAVIGGLLIFLPKLSDLIQR